MASNTIGKPKDDPLGLGVDASAVLATYCIAFGLEGE